MGKDYNTKTPDANSGSGSTGKKTFWMDQILEGLKQYPAERQPQIPKLGQRLWDPDDQGLENTEMSAPSVPAIMKIGYVPYIGTPANDYDPSNLDGAFSNILATMRQKTTTAYNYDQGTLAATIMSVGMIPVLLAHIKRRMKAAFTNSLGSNLSADDIWIPFSDGFSGSKVQALEDMDQKISTYNDIVGVYNSLRMPNFFPVLRRWEEMESKVFRDLQDDPNGCAQLFYFASEGYYYPEESTDPQNPGFILKWKSYFGDLGTELSYVYELVKTVQGNQDMVQVLGDICKTYGDDPYLVDLLKEEDLKGGLESEYNYEVLIGLYHATILPIRPTDSTITALTGKLTCKYDFKSDYTSVPKLYRGAREWLRTPKMFNSQEYGLNKEMFAAACQWMIVDNEYATHNGSVANVGTEILVRMEIWGNQFDAGQAHFERVETDISALLVIQNEPITEFKFGLTTMGVIAAKKTFAYGPMLPTWYYECNSDYSSVVHKELLDPDVEMEYPCFVDAATLKQWHRAMRYRLWGLPHLIQFEGDGKAKAYWN